MNTTFQSRSEVPHSGMAHSALISSQQSAVRIKSIKVAIILFFSIAALTNIYAQSGQKYSTGRNTLTPSDGLGSLNYEGLNFYTDNIKRGSFTKDGGFALLTRGFFYSNVYCDSLLTVWKISTQEIQTVTAIITGNAQIDGTLAVGGVITIDGANSRISSSSGTIDFDANNLTTTGNISAGNIATQTATVTDSLTANHVTSNHITSNNLTSNNVTSSFVTTNQLTANQATTGQLTSNLFSSDTITANQLTINELTLNSFAGTHEGLLKYNTNGIINPLDFPSDTNAVLTGGGAFKNLGSMVAPYTGWQWYDTTVLLSAAPVVAIQNNLVVGGRVSIGSIRMSNGSSRDTLATAREFAIEAEKIFLKSDTVTVNGLQVTTQAGKLSLEAQQADTISIPSPVVIGKDTSNYPPPVTGIVALKVNGNATFKGDIAVRGNIEALNGTVSSNEVRTNNINSALVSTDSLDVSGSMHIRDSLKIGNSIWLGGAGGVQPGDNTIYSSGLLAIQSNSSYPYDILLNYNNAGRVGIGAPSPGSKLHVAGSADITENIGIGTNAIAAHRMYMYGDMKEMIRIDAPDNTPQAGIVFTRHSQNNKGWLYLENYNAGGPYPNQHRLVMETGWDGDYDYIVMRNNSWMTGEKDVMAIHNSKVVIDANVGIGISSPDAELHVRRPTSPSSSFSHSEGALFKVQQSSNDDWAAEIYNSGGYSKGLRILADGGTSYPLLQLDEASTGNTRFVVQGNGNVGIGTDDPQEKLHVTGKGVFGPGNASVLSTGILTDYGVQIYEATGTPPPYGKVSLIIGDTNYRSMFFASYLGGAAYNPLVQEGDIGIIYRNSSRGATPPGFVIGQHTFGNWVFKGIRIDPDGNVGVGTATPQAKLHVQDGSIRIENATGFWADGWKNAIETPMGYVWKTTEASNINSKYYGLGVTNTGWYWITADGPGAGVNYKYPMQLTIDGCGKPALTISQDAWCDNRFDRLLKPRTWDELDKYFKDLEENYLLSRHLESIKPEKEIIPKGLDITGTIYGLTLNMEDTRMDMIEIFKVLKEYRERIENLEKENNTLKMQLKSK